jgi:hypothetical protein
MSSFITRPLLPLPWTVEMSRLLALAIARTAGVASDLERRAAYTHGQHETRKRTD